MTYLVIQCGSIARGDANPNSDSDIICIWHAKPPDYRRLENKYGDVMYYSLDTISNMKKHGSLFLTHLDIDGIHLEGERNIANIFKNFRPLKEQLEKTSQNSIDFLKNIKWYPNSETGFLWLNDVIYVALRNIIFCSNAKNNIFAFSYETAIQLNPKAMPYKETLLKIRENKYEYRRNCSSKETKIDIKEISMASSEILKSAIELQKGGETNWQKKWKNDYWDAREIERSIVNNELTIPNFLDMLKKQNYCKFKLKKEMRKIISIMQNTTKPI